MYPTKLLLVIDMQKDFVDEDGTLSIYPALGKEKTEKLISNVAEAITNFKGRVLYTLDTHTPDSCEFESFPPHCVEETKGWELTDKVCEAISTRELETQRVIHDVKKVSFNGTSLSDYLARTFDDMEFHIAGVCTHICVHDVVAGLVHSMKEKHNKLPKIVIDRKLVGDFDEEMAEFALKRMHNLYGVEVV